MSTRLLRSGLIVVALMALTVGLVGLASAAPPFDWDQNGGFTLGSESSLNGPGTGISFFGPLGPPAPPLTFQTIGWGNQDGPSFVTGTDPFSQVGSPENARSVLSLDTFSGTIDVGQTVTISTVTHANRRILSPFLTGVTFDTQLRIRDGVTEVLADLGSIPVTFTETINRANEGLCDPATHIATTAPCSDFFLFPLGGGALEDITFITPADGFQYSLSFSLVPGPGTLFEVVDCDGIPGGATCGRVRTAELTENTIDITMTLNLLGQAALQVSKSPDGGLFLPGGQAIFTIVVTNLSDCCSAVNVVLTDQLPGNGGLVWQTATPSPGGSCTIGAGGDPANFLRCNLGDIPSGGSVTVTVSSTPTTPLAACQSQPNPVALATAEGGLQAQDSGSLTCVPPAVFVIGDVEPHGLGDVVNFWGAQWWKNNFMSGFVSNGVAAFKGFASQNDLFCGGTWTSLPGNSSNPPATIPEFVAIIVTDTVLKNGPNISGNIKEILIVQQDGGYGPNPGHPGNGPVTAISCQVAD